MMLETCCHCGAVRIEIPRKPRSLTDCNCSICRRYAPLWAYYLGPAVRIHAARRDRVLSVGRPAHPLRALPQLWLRHPLAGGAQAAHAPLGRELPQSRPAALGGIRVRHLDGASTWKFLD